MSPLADRQVDADGQEVQEEKRQKRVGNAVGQHLTPYRTIALKNHGEDVTRVIRDRSAKAEILALPRLGSFAGAAGESH